MSSERRKSKYKLSCRLGFSNRKGVESDLFTLKNEMESTENNLKVQEEVLRNLPRQEMQKKRHEIDELKRKINKIQSQINKAENQSSKLTSSFDDLKVKAPYLIHPTQLLGKDSERNLYFVILSI
jgi:seryl-tRNA synthetase